MTAQALRTHVKDLLWVIVFAGMAAAVLRFAFGLGATTGLNDASPWGLWIAFKLGFVALAGGGFTLAGMVHVFHLESYRPALRRAILLAMLGYGSFIVSLIFDLGLPWHIYMPVIHWQHHSVMFEIAWCVMLYFSVLVMEFGPVILEHPWFRAPVFRSLYRLLKKATVPLVIAGIVLSTLHQSSLGSLFLIMPHRVHPLWYSPWIPVLFFISAIAAGLLALVVEGFLARRLFDAPLRQDLLRRLGRTAGFVLLLYLGLRVGDLALRGVLPQALSGGWQSWLFLGEVVLGGLLPAAILLSPVWTRRREALLTAAFLGIAGVLSQRMSLSLFTMFRPLEAPYRPSGLEVVIAFAIPAAAGLLYFLFVENLAVATERLPLRPRYPLAGLQFDPVSGLYRDDTLWGQVARRSGWAILVLALIVAALPTGAVRGQDTPPAPSLQARGWDVLLINGDGDGKRVLFPHLEHQERLEADCQACHHLNYPEDQATGCWQCHQDAYGATSIFNHVEHQSSLGGNAACGECHQGEHLASTAVRCGECHEDMAAAGGFQYVASGYQDAMHARCLDCHSREAQLQERPELAECAACHLFEEGERQLAGLNRPPAD